MGKCCNSTIRIYDRIYTINRIDASVETLQPHTIVCRMSGNPVNHVNPVKTRIRLPATQFYFSSSPKGHQRHSGSCRSSFGTRVTSPVSASDST